jgi:hypothetical protein
MGDPKPNETEEHDQKSNGTAEAHDQTSNGTAEAHDPTSNGKSEEHKRFEVGAVDTPTEEEEKNGHLKPPGKHLNIKQ